MAAQQVRIVVLDGDADDRDGERERRYCMARFMPRIAL
jgi:hypothetical protein